MSLIRPPEAFGKESDYSVFDETDPFNPTNRVVGFLCHKMNEFYGALYITQLNGKSHPNGGQLIMATPKMHYPFSQKADGRCNYLLPKALAIERYEKLDGTNIFAYLYGQGFGVGPFLSFKLRTRPFVSNSKFGPFADMWREIAGDKLTQIRQAIISNKCNLAFEMYGARNLHLIKYEVPLALALLFGVDNRGHVWAPSFLRDVANLPRPLRYADVTRDYVYNYELAQSEAEATLSPVDEYYTGHEGQVWYLTTVEGHCLQFKCKPETIEEIHWAAGRHLSRNVITAACWKSLESSDTITEVEVCKILAEDFPPEDLDSSALLIASCVATVTKELEFRHSVQEAYLRVGLNILTHKAEVLRALSKEFKPAEMHRVYTTLVNY